MFLFNICQACRHFYIIYYYWRFYYNYIFTNKPPCRPHPGSASLSPPSLVGYSDQSVNENYMSKYYRITILTRFEWINSFTGIWNTKVCIQLSNHFHGRQDPPPLSEYATGVSSLEYCLTNLSFYAAQHCEYLRAEHEYASCCLTSLCKTHWRWWKSSYGAGPESWRWSCFSACRYFGLSDCFVCLKPASWVLWFAVATLA